METTERKEEHTDARMLKSTTTTTTTTTTKFPTRTTTKTPATGYAGDSTWSSSSSSSSSMAPFPSMTFALFLYWIVPIVLLSIFGRRGVDIESATRLPPAPDSSGTSIYISPDQLDKAARDYQRKKEAFEEQFYDQQQKQQKQKKKKKKKKQNETLDEIVKDSSSFSPATMSKTTTTATPPTPRKETIDTSSWPTSYRSVVQEIQTRRPQWHHGPNKALALDGKMPASSTIPTRSQSKKKHKTMPMDSSPERKVMRERIEKLREEYKDSSNRGDILKALEYADAMRTWSMTFFDGGSYDNEAINVYTNVLIQLRQKKKLAQQKGLRTDVTAIPGVAPEQQLQGLVARELHLPYPQKSIDGLLCAVYTALGKIYFMANLFERSEQVLSSCLEIEPNYLDAALNRGSARIVLGMLDEAAQDYATVVVHDFDHVFADSYSGLVRILEAKEDAIPTGWDFVVSRLQDIVPKFEAALPTQTDPQYIHAISGALRRYHHALFVYHDKKTKDYDAAWNHLTQSHHYKLKVYAPYQKGSERNRFQQIQAVFRTGFWTPGMGSNSRTPIFVIGFARSGSTLLERVLDAHPQVAGTGENSVFNGRLDSIRYRLVKASANGGRDVLRLTRDMADEVVEAMQERWEYQQAQNVKGVSDGRDDDKDADADADADATQQQQKQQPLRLVDKMLTNYFNVGFINLLFPNALILHVLRQPMDTIFSAFKHDFPSDRLAYTGDPEFLAELYTTYRDTMEHWEDVLPGRITHVRYEDLVHDMPGMARAIINAAGLEWDDSVLEFYKKKHAVNTYSSTQVRKKVYKYAIHSWKRYQEHFAPIMNPLLGEHIKYDQKTTLPGYQRPKTANTRDEL